MKSTSTHQPVPILKPSACVIKHVQAEHVSETYDAWQVKHQHDMSSNWKRKQMYIWVVGTFKHFIKVETHICTHTHTRTHHKQLRKSESIELWARCIQHTTHLSTWTHNTSLNMNTQHLTTSHKINSEHRTTSTLNIAQHQLSTWTLTSKTCI